MSLGIGNNNNSLITTFRSEDAPNHKTRAVNGGNSSSSVKFSYDELNKLGLLEKIFAMIPEKESAEFDAIYGMVLSDIRENELSTKYVVEKTLTKIGTALGEVINPLLEQAVAQMPELMAQISK